MSLDLSITGDTGQPGRCEQCGTQGAGADVTEAVVTEGLLRRLVGRFRRTSS